MKCVEHTWKLKEKKDMIYSAYIYHLTLWFCVFVIKKGGGWLLGDSGIVKKHEYRGFTGQYFPMIKFDKICTHFIWNDLYLYFFSLLQHKWCDIQLNQCKNIMHVFTEKI